MLRLENICKGYQVGENYTEVLKNISLEFRDNEFVSILGASGSGKTTLLNIIGGLDKYDKGELIINGVSTKKYYSGDWDSYRNHSIGFIFQGYNLISHQSILSNVELSLTLSGIPAKKRKSMAIEALKKVGLGDHINKKPNQLSGGQMQRVAIARALINNPDIILADEPTGALDTVTSVQIMDLLKEIAKDKLVIMVTHNPELAKEYSTRIIELSDGHVCNDTMPVVETETIDDKSRAAQERKSGKKKGMPFLTSLGLSYRNLLTKKGRTILTAIAGSIGIVGIALVLSLSNGINRYFENMQRTSMSDYPIEIKQTSIDLFSAISKLTVKEEINDGKIHSSNNIASQLTSSNKAVATKNDMVSFKKFIESNKNIEDSAVNIAYTYDITPHIYKSYKDGYMSVSPNVFNKMAGINDGTSSETSSEVFIQNAYTEQQINDKYELIAGNMAKEATDLMLVIPNDNYIDESLLFSLGIRDMNEYKDYIDRLENDKEAKLESRTYEYNDFIGITYKLVLGVDFYQQQENGYVDLSNDVQYVNQLAANGQDLKIVGVLRAKEAEAQNTNEVWYQQSLIDYIIDKSSLSPIYKEQSNNKQYNVVTGEAFDGVLNTYDSRCTSMGIVDINNPSTIKIYPKSADAKTTIEDEINKYNEDCRLRGEEDKVISYEDMMKAVLNSATSAVKAVSAVIIAFVAISLIVSSIMIGIITYISVLERTKEIGILRAVGASKTDVKRVFLAETVIEGFMSGVLGVVVCFILCLIVNLIAGMVSSFNKIAILSPVSAIVLIVLSTLITVVAGIIPAGVASKKKPVDSLRG